ncbi:MAG: DDE-type integrase/transposase/recombinase [Elusimicrobiota bacterium]|nr:DDE-type integrase/transposase/recombinase [Elusimicrobiota bacterium]
MHNITNPAEEAQVDFGYAGLVADIDSKIKNSWVFCMELTYSNKSYYETVFRQDVRTFLSCHINAFRYFGGVPKTVKIDNIKSAILKASFYEPEYQKEYLRFANYYGFAPIPCRIYTPTDKASVETQVGYVKNNFFKGRKFVNISDCNLQLPGG